MTDEREYRDHEVRQILDLAIRDDDVPERLAPGDGLTLAELQEVGRGIGLPSDRMARAVAEFEARGESLPRGTTLGLPVSVGRVVPLPRPPSEREWEMLIAEFRSTFGGKGDVSSHGSLREWSHGTVHVFVEPTETGHRLRLTDSSAAAGGVMVLGGFFLAFALLIFVVLLGKEDPGTRFVVPAFFSAIGSILAGGTVVALPRWAREQERRMEHVARHATALLGPTTSEHEPE